MGSLQLGLPRVVQIWASQLAELDPVPADKLDVLLRVCGGGSANEGERLSRCCAAVGVVDSSMQNMLAMQLQGHLRRAAAGYGLTVAPASLAFLSCSINTFCLQEMHYRGHCHCPAFCTSRKARCVLSYSCI